MRVLISILLVLLSATTLVAQDISANNEIDNIIKRLHENKPNQGKVVVKQDAQIANLLDLHVLQNAKNPGMQGFRIRIFFELGQNARRNSEESMRVFMEKYPGVKVYQSYDNPYWKISVGDFRSRESAQKFYQQLLVDYPKAFIIPDWVNFPSLE
ncbi:MAG: SPOR domain-containing protein [Bacteroidales bacterium]|nr:MAG: SPOR domain-containing protein [Bacteroidales bacterium]